MQSRTLEGYKDCLFCRNYDAYYYRGRYADYCLEHKAYHCHDHKRVCEKKYGNSIMDYGPDIVEKRKLELLECDKDWCTFVAQDDNINLELVKCAECGKVFYCNCFYDSEGLDKFEIREFGHALEGSEWDEFYLSESVIAYWKKQYMRVRLGLQPLP